MGGPGSGRRARADGLFNCRETAKLLNVTVNDVYRRVKEGILLPDKTVGENYFFSSHTVSLEKTRAKRESTERGEGFVFSAEEAVGVYQGLADGKTLDRLVIELKMHPFAVEAAAKSWARIRGGMFLTKMTLDLISKLPLEGHFPLAGEDELIEVLTKASSEKVCTTCEKHTASDCKMCVRKAVREGERRGAMAERKKAATPPELVEEPLSSLPLEEAD